MLTQFLRASCKQVGWQPTWVWRVAAVIPPLVPKTAVIPPLVPKKLNATPQVPQFYRPARAFALAAALLGANAFGLGIFGVIGWKVFVRT